MTLPHISQLLRDGSIYYTCIYLRPKYHCILIIYSEDLFI